MENINNAKVRIYCKRCNVHSDNPRFIYCPHCSSKLLVLKQKKMVVAR